MKRIEAIDIAKGLGILLVVTGHSGMPDKAQWWIWSFHMPLFFFISGLFFSPDKYKTFDFLLQKKGQSLLLPYLYFTLIVLVLKYILDPVTFPGVLKYTITDGWGGIALWFLPVLFFTELLFWLVSTRVKRALLLSVLFLFSIVGYFISLKSVHLPYKLEAVLTSVFFYGTGYFLKDYLNSNLSRLTVKASIGLGAGFLLLNVATCFLNSTRFDICFNVIGNYGFAYASALSGTIFIILVANVITRVGIGKLTTVLTFFGKNTLILLACHQIVMLLLIKSFTLITIAPLVSTLLRHSLLWTILVLLIFVINRHFPFLTGKGTNRLQLQKSILTPKSIGSNI